MSGNSSDHSEGHPGEPTDGSGPDFTHSATDNVRAADGLANGIEPDTARAGGWADEATAALVTAFGAKDGHGWLTSSAISQAHNTWGEQVQGLVSRLTLDESALRTALTLGDHALPDADWAKDGGIWGDDPHAEKRPVSFPGLAIVGPDGAEVQAYCTSATSYMSFEIDFMGERVEETPTGYKKLMPLVNAFVPQATKKFDCT